MSDTLSLDELKRLIMSQKEKIERLEKKVGVAERQAEAAEQYSRGDCLILRGKLNIRPNVSIRDEVMRLISFHTGVRFPSWCLNTAHWLGGGNSIIVRFNNKAVRDEVYRNRVPKEVEKRGLFIHESLTASKMALVSRCAALRNQGHIMTYYTQNGNVLVKKTKSSPSMLITTDMTTDDIITKVQNQPNTYREAAAREGHRQETTNTNSTKTTSTNMPGGEPEQGTSSKQNTDKVTGGDTGEGGEKKQRQAKQGEETVAGATQKEEREVEDKTGPGGEKVDTKTTQKSTETQSEHEETESQSDSDNTDESDNQGEDKEANFPKPANKKHEKSVQKVKDTKQKTKNTSDVSKSPSDSHTPAKKIPKKKRRGGK